MCTFECGSVVFFFFKQKTAYEMRISDWSSDVCSSDLHDLGGTAADRVDAGVACHALDLAVAQVTGTAMELHAVIGDGIDQFAAERLDHREIGRASCRERVCQYV